MPASKDQADHISGNQKSDLAINVAVENLKSQDERDATSHFGIARNETGIKQYRLQGLSTGLQYPPGSWASTDELVELCKTAAACGGIYATHVRYDIGNGVFDGFREALSIGRRSGCPVHISHYYATIPLRGQTARMLQFVDDARASGVDLTFDAYPYEAGSTSMTIAAPQWAHRGGPYELLKRLQNKNDRDKMRGQSSSILGQIEGIVMSTATWAPGCFGDPSEPPHVIRENTLSMPW